MLPKPSPCQGCPLYLSGQGFAGPEGSPSAKIWLVGEALGEQEASQGRPFVGGAGRTLNALLFSAGLKRSDVYITNTVKCRPMNPPNRTPKFEEINYCVNHYLKYELEQATSDTTIVPLGAVPLAALTGKKGIMKWRGSSLYTNSVRIIPTIHPAHLMRQQKMWATVVFDLKKASRPEPLASKFLYITKPTYDQVITFLTYLDLSKPLIIDIENSWDKECKDSPFTTALLCIGLLTGDQAMCLPWLYKGSGEEYWPEHQKEKIIELLNLVLANADMAIYHNNLHDILCLRSMGFTVAPCYFDTMLAHHLLFAELPHKLPFLTSVYSTLIYYKDDIKSDQGMKQVGDEEFWLYNLKDLHATYDSFIGLVEELEEMGLTQFFFDQVMPLCEVIIGMMMRGIKADPVLAKKLSKELEPLIEQKLADIRRLAGSLNLNPLSPKQLVEYFHVSGPKKYPVIRRTETTKVPSVDEDVLEKLYTKYGSLVAYEIIQYRKVAKIKSTYLDSVERELEADGRIHCSYLIHGTVTGRLSSREPNLQNIPEDLRQIYVAEEGKLLYKFDYSQADLRVMAHLIQDPEWCAIFADPSRNIHLENQKLLEPYFDRPAGEVKKGKTGKDFAKTFIYGAILYGGDISAVLMAWPGIMSMDKGRKLQDNFLANKPLLMNYRQEVYTTLEKTRTCWNPFGRPRKFFGPEHDIKKAGLDTPIQGGVADILNAAMIRLHKLGMPGMQLQTHDDLVMEWTEEEAKVWEPIVKREMELPVKFIMSPSGEPIERELVSIPVEMGCGKNWLEASK